jgi:methyl-accepting chemotaxis protein
MREKMEETVEGAVATSQTLSEAAFEQAAFLEETSSSLEMASMTRVNNENTSQARHLITCSNEIVCRANASMAELTRSVQEIAAASEETQKIVKSLQSYQAPDMK